MNYHDMRQRKFALEIALKAIEKIGCEKFNEVASVDMPGDIFSLVTWEIELILEQMRKTTDSSGVNYAVHV